MKKLEITTAQRVLLVEMATVLFPKHKFLMWSQDHPDYSNVSDIMIFDDNTWNIHWFEFISTHLLWELQERIDNYNLFDGIVYNTYTFPGHENDSLGFSHPVDYLYSEFKKIK